MPKYCRRCKVNNAVVYLTYSREYLCLDCFNKFFENRVKKTVEKYRMLKGEVIGIGLSGGKDSAALLYSMKKIFPGKRFIAIHLYHGIGDYSRDSYEQARKLSEMLDIEFHVFDYEKEIGVIIPDVEYTRYRNKVCSVCGIIRRWALSRAAKEVGVDVLATGHNLDDIVEVMLNLFIAGEFDQLRRLKPILPPEHPTQVWKVKPLFKSPEMDNYFYTMYNELPVKRISCPYYITARSIRRKRLLDEWEKTERNIKFQLLSTFMKKLIPLIDREAEEVPYSTCKICGGPSMGEICSACKRIMMIKDRLIEKGLRRD